ncbi:MAG TPA: lipid-binding SYLF domain-containing protein [Pyrinomonadaceae bacterium]|jgi:SH3 domain-containing YSC84-like protein 1|nr:lipid-binding SYLF domain-containing protein [Pyrinomonadaceae bacterium]
MKRVIFTGFILFALSIGIAAQNDKEVAQAAKTAQKATQALDEIMAIRDKSIPADLLRKAKAVAVFPNVIKGAFIVGGQGGKGLIVERVGNAWGPPALFKLGGGSVGFQIGGSSTDFVMLFMTDDSVRKLLEDKFQIGGEISAAAGPVGRTANASTDVQLAQILSYSRSKGLFAGLSVSGVVISPDNDANRALYGHDAKELLSGAALTPPVVIPPATKPFQQAVARYSR